VASLGANRNPLRPTYALFSRDGVRSPFPFTRPSADALLPQDSAEPYQRNTHHSAFTALDRNRLHHLREWVAAPERVLDAASDFERSIVELPPHSRDTGAAMFFDLLCLVLLVSWPGDGTLPVLFVWDGTDARPCDPFGDPLPPGVAGQPPPTSYTPRQSWELPLAAAVASQAAGGHAWPTAAFLGGVPPIGTALPVVLTQEAAMSLRDESKLPRAGSWVRIRGLLAMSHRGQLQAAYLVSSRWAPAASGAGSMAGKLLSDADARFKGGKLAFWAPGHGGRVPTQGCPTRVPPFALAIRQSTLREAMAKPAPQRFRVCCRVTAVEPHVSPDTGDGAHLLTQPTAAMHKAAAAAAALRGEPPPPPPAASHCFALRLTLTDATGSLQAALVGDEGARFFHGVPAVAMLPGCAEAVALAAKLRRLLCRGEPPAPEGEEAAEKAVWIQLCLESYVDARFDAARVAPADAMEAGVKRFRIFETVLL